MTAAFTLRLDDETLKALDRLAEKTDRSRSWLAARAVEDYIALNAWQIEKIEAGIDAANRGDFAGDQEVARVLCGWRNPRERVQGSRRRPVNCSASRKGLASRD
jgi:predicted transcriptional regulator